MDIAIIGSGLSGLTAGFKIVNELKTDNNINIFEKEQTPGGRIMTKGFNGCPMELGGMIYIENGVVHNLLKSLNLESNLLLDKNNFLSVYDEGVYKRDEYLKSKLSQQEKREIKKIREFAKNLNIDESYKDDVFEVWYKENIGHELVPFWNRMLMSLGVKNMASINAYFGLTLVYILISSRNYVQQDGLGKLIERLLSVIESKGGYIHYNSEILSIKKIDSKFKLKVKQDQKIKELFFDKVVSAIQPEHLSEICDFKFVKLLKKIRGHPLSVFVIQSDTQIWNDTWGLVVLNNNSPIKIILDYKNIERINNDAPFIVFSDFNTTKEEIFDELQGLFNIDKTSYKLLYQKNWDNVIHQQDEHFYSLRKKILKVLPDGFYIAGDWMVLPALEGAVISGLRIADSLINELHRGVDA